MSFVNYHGRESSTSRFIATSAGGIFPGNSGTSCKYLISYLLTPLSLQLCPIFRSVGMTLFSIMKTNALSFLGLAM